MAPPTLTGIRNARVVTANGVIEHGAVRLDGGRIAAVTGADDVPESGGLDAAGRYLLPGLIDVHSDNIEQQLNPRPRVTFPPLLAMLEADRLFATCGVTTVYHAIGLKEDEDRSIDTAQTMLDTISCHQNGSRVRHETHLRCELSQPDSIAAVLGYLEQRPAAIVSLMNHTPGYGKYRDPAWMVRHSSRPARNPEAAIPPPVDAGVAAVHAARSATVAAAASKTGAILFSHDDFDAEQVRLQASLGVTVSEFPIDAVTARSARALGMAVCMGAPNVVRGRSHGGSIPATEAIRLGLVDVLCSDYHPPSLIHAVFRLVRDGVATLPEATALASGGPAAALGLADRGEIRPGAVADLILVEERHGLPVVSHTIVDGVIVATG